MWLIGSLLSQVAIFVFASQDWRPGWFIYMSMTLIFSAVGVFTFGFAALFTVHYYPKAFTSITNWYFGIPVGIFCGWLATALLFVTWVIFTGHADQLVRSFEWILPASIGSLYGLVGASYMLLTKDNKKSEPSD